MFYNKSVNVYELQVTEDEWGAAVENSYVLQKKLRVDMQPNSREKLRREYGYDLDTTKRMFCEVDDSVTESAIVEYNGEPYEVTKIIKWDSHLDVALNDAIGVRLHD